MYSFPPIGRVHQSSVISHQSSVISHSSFIVHRSSFITHPPRRPNTPSYHANVTANPLLKSTIGSYPSISLAFPTSANECLKSPFLSGLYTGSRSIRRQCCRISVASSLSDTLPPHATLITSPLSRRSARAASKFACTALSTNVKSRDVVPSPKMTGGSP